MPTIRITGNTTDCAFTCTTTQACFAGNGTVDFNGICREFQDVCCDLPADTVLDEDPGRRLPGRRTIFP
jgi:hypothetical protein